MQFKKLFKHSYTIGYISIIGFILLDQLTKQIAYMNQNNLLINKVFIKYLLEFSYTENRAASLGLLGDHPQKDLIFMLITVLALVMFGYFFKDIDFKTKKTYSISIVFFFAGTLGNAIDRLFRGFVIDFLHFPFFDFLSQIGLSNFDNNIADILLTFAIILFAIDMFFFDPKRTKELKKDEKNHN